MKKTFYMKRGNEDSNTKDWINHLIYKGETFEVQKTKYTTKIVLPDIKVIFNDDGRKDNRVLKLISSVRKDANEYLELLNLADKELNNEKIDFFKLVNFVPQENIVFKIDIKAAYWTYATKNNIITEKTNSLFEKLYTGTNYDVAKSGRLKALGSLATTKSYQFYENGVLLEDKSTIKTEKTKDLYMHICAGIDNLMKDTIANTDGIIYYYWDCLFCLGGFEKQVIDYIQSKQYKVKTGVTKISIENIFNNKYLKSESDGKMYLVDMNHRHLLEQYK